MPSVAEMTAAFEPPTAGIAPPKSALKRRSDDDPRESTEHPAKRPKVSFVEPISLPSPPAVEERPLNLVREEIRRAFSRRARNEPSEYSALIRRIQYDPKKSVEDQLSPVGLQRHVVALTNLAFDMGRTSVDLLEALLDSGWIAMDDDVIFDFRRFLGILIATHGNYASVVLRWLIQRFTTPLVETKQAEEDNEDQITEYQFVANDPEIIVTRTHQVISHVLSYAPTSLGTLSELLEEGFPYYTADSKTHVDYVNNLLRVREYCPAQEAGLLQLIIEKLVAIDVQIVANTDELDDDLLDEIMDSLYASDEPLEEEDSTEDAQERLARSVAKAALEKMKDSMRKLDAMMDIVFQHYDAICSSSEEPDIATVDQLVSVFSRNILASHNSRHVQYLYFRLSQKISQFYDRWARALLNIAIDINQSGPIRVAAISYIGSFVARGSQVSDAQVRAVFKIFRQKLDELLTKYAENSRGPDPDRYRFYYSLFQASMYVFCFRWRAFIREDPEYDEDGTGVLDDLQSRRWDEDARAMFTRHIHSVINPLKACSPIVVDMFAKVAQSLDFLFIYSRIETNKRVRLCRAITSGSVGREGSLSYKISEKDLQLESHFAFEPYLLPKSRVWVEDLYTLFEAVAPPGMQDDDSEDDSDGDGKDE
jgi:RNA polymerase I-specific transcription initiation factor RRN3